MSWRDDIFEDDDITLNPPGSGRGGGKVGPPREDKDRRVSPNPQTALGETKPHWEYMEKGHIREKDGRAITIDIDRNGGVFLDHGELARILAGQTDVMINDITHKIDEAQERIRTNEGHNKNFYRVP